MPSGTTWQQMFKKKKKTPHRKKPRSFVQSYIYSSLKKGQVHSYACQTSQRSLRTNVLKLVSFWTEKRGSWLCLPVPKCSILFLILTLSQYLLIKLTKLFRLTSSLRSNSVLSSLCRARQLVLNYYFHSRASPSSSCPRATLGHLHF